MPPLEMTPGPRFKCQIDERERLIALAAESMRMFRPNKDALARLQRFAACGTSMPATAGFNKETLKEIVIMQRRLIPHRKGRSSDMQRLIRTGDPGPKKGGHEANINQRHYFVN